MCWHVDFLISICFWKLMEKHERKIILNYHESFYFWQSLYAQVLESLAYR